MMTQRQKDAMAAGRDRARRKLHDRSVARVAVYRAWLAAGSVLAAIPEIPSDHDWHLATSPPDVATLWSDRLKGSGDGVVCGGDPRQV